MRSYQIADFAHEAESHAETLRNAIRRNFADLGISLDLLALFDDKTAVPRDRKAPTVGVYFGLTRYPSALPALSGLLKEATLGHQSAVKSLQSAQVHSWLGGLR
ncbi:MAG: hypothetical protein ABSG25_14850 [Bryobacteraceae bacterium]